VVFLLAFEGQREVAVCVEDLLVRFDDELVGDGVADQLVGGVAQALHDAMFQPQEYGVN